MRTGISFTVSATDQKRLERIVLLSSAGYGTHGVMQATGKLKTCVWRWQERFMEAGIDGLLRDMDLSRKSAGYLSHLRSYLFKRERAFSA